MKYNYDPELIPIVDLLPKIDFTDIGHARAEAKELIKQAPVPDSSKLNITEEKINPDKNDPPIWVRVYTPKSKQGRTPALLQIHGGGYIIGDLDSEHDLSIRLALDLGVVVVSVDYRLAPEFPYPAALHDCYNALCWLHENASSLGVEPSQIGVFGQSAGGGLAAALALYSRDNNGPNICHQCLIFPELDDRLETTSAQYDDTPIWYRRNALLSWQYYLGSQYTRGAEGIPYTASPARASARDLAGLPPAYITAMEFDPLRDEDIAYATELLKAGVSVELHSFKGTFHGSTIIAGHANISRRSHEEMIYAISRGLYEK